MPRCQDGAEKVPRCREGAEKVLRCRDGAEMVPKKCRGAERVPKRCRGAELVLRFLPYANSIFLTWCGTPQVLKNVFCRRSIKSLYRSIGLSVLIANFTVSIRTRRIITNI